MSCPHQGRVDAHFAGQLAPARERALREHLASCPSCRDRYERQLMLASIDPQAPSFKERLAAGLGLRGRWASLRPLLLAAAAATAVLLALSLWQDAPPRHSDFQARGGEAAAAQAKLVAYRITAGKRTAPLGETLSARTELAFAYANPQAKGYLMVFGQGSDGRVYWYHPEWRDPQANPAALAISAKPGLHELPAAIRHPIRGPSLTLAGLFLDRPLTVREVEALLQKHRPGKLPLPDAGQTVRTIRVVP